MSPAASVGPPGPCPQAGRMGRMGRMRPVVRPPGGPDLARSRCGAPHAVVGAGDQEQVGRAGGDVDARSVERGGRGSRASSRVDRTRLDGTAPPLGEDQSRDGERHARRAHLGRYGVSAPASVHDERSSPPWSSVSAGQRYAVGAVRTRWSAPPSAVTAARRNSAPSEPPTVTMTPRRVRSRGTRWKPTTSPSRTSSMRTLGLLVRVGGGVTGVEGVIAHVIRIPPASASRVAPTAPRPPGTP